MHTNARTHRAAFVKKMKSNPLSGGARKRMGKRLAAYRAAQHKGLGKKRAARSALRRVPFTKSERRRGYSFKGLKQRYRRNDGDAPSFAGTTKIGLGPAPEAEVKTRKMTRKERKAALRRGGKPRKSRKARKGRRKSRKARKGRARARQYQKVGKRRIRVRFGKFKRVRMSDPSRRGRKRLSYMSRGKKGRLRKIPVWAIAGAPSAKAYKRSPEKYAKARARIAKRRASAARRVERRGSAFVPNRSSAARFRRLRAYGEARRRGLGKRKAAAAAVREVPFNESEKARGASFVGITAGERTVAKRKRRKGRKSRKARKSRKRKTRKSARRSRKSRGRRVKANRKRRRTHRRRRVHANRKRRHARHRKSRKARRNTQRRARARHYEDNPRRKRRKHRKTRANRKRRYRSNRGRRYHRNPFMSDLKHLLKIGGIALLGFLGHRLATAVSADFIMKPLTKNAAPDSMIVTWSKPIAGAGIGLLGIVGLSMIKGMKAETKASVGAGLMISWLQSVAISLFTQFKQPKVVSYLEGYSNSTAYQLRGHRGGYRGIGAERHARSIGPHYAPIGQYQQAAAGLGRAAAVGEYFASDGVQGVGNYEKAGPLALLPTYSATGQAPIVDGIRPDANLDQVMDLAESAAGLGQGYQQAAAGLGRRRGMRGMGEYFSAKPSDGSFSEFSVPTQSQWIPNGPLWAGEMKAQDTPTESEVPAGILQGPGGNGVLSG